MIKWRSKLISNIREFYASKFNESDVPHIYAICLVSIIDFLIVYSLLTNFSTIDKGIVILLCLILLIMNWLIYVKVKPTNKRIQLYNVVYVVVFVISFLVLYVL